MPPKRLSPSEAPEVALVPEIQAPQGSGLSAAQSLTASPVDGQQPLAKVSKPPCAASSASLEVNFYLSSSCFYLLF